MGGDRVKLTNCGKVEWGKKCHYAKWHTLWMTPCLVCYFIAILFFILCESEFLWAI